MYNFNFVIKHNEKKTKDTHLPYFYGIYYIILSNVNKLVLLEEIY